MFASNPSFFYGQQKKNLNIKQREYYREQGATVEVEVVLVVVAVAVAIPKLVVVLIAIVVMPKLVVSVCQPSFCNITRSNSKLIDQSCVNMRKRMALYIPS